MKIDSTEWESKLRKSLSGEYPLYRKVIDSLISRGARCHVVGGAVRDFLRDDEIGDLDVEIFKLELPDIEEELSRFGRVLKIGKAFGVFKLKGLDVDFCLPRRDSKVAPGHQGFDIECEPSMSLREAARRRDLTINAIAVDLDSHEIIDPFNGMSDLENRILRAVDRKRFGDDPLRVYRTAQFAARFGFEIEPGTIRLSSAMSSEGLSSERVFAEFEKLLVKGKNPSHGFEFIRAAGWISNHPELSALIGVEQDPEWHPEGDVWIHTMLALDKAVELRYGEREKDLKLMFAVLCHDFGKATMTRIERGRIRSLGHEQEGGELATRFMERLTAEKDLVSAVRKLVAEHLKPALLAEGGITGKAVKRLAGRLAPEAGIELLVRVARADHMSRLGIRSFEAGDLLLEKASEMEVEREPEKPVLLGRHLIKAGLSPGREFGIILKKAFEIQITEGIKKPGELLGRVLDDQTSAENKDI